MLTEIHEQPQATAETLEGRLGEDCVLYSFADSALGMRSGDGLEAVHLPECPEIISPMVYTVP